MKNLGFLSLLFLFFNCQQKSEPIAEKTIEKTILMTEASRFFESINNLQSPDLPENYQELNNPVNITAVYTRGDLSAKVALGKKLYFDKSLSKNGNISCNSCHNLDTYGVDNLPTSPGDEHLLGGRNSPTVIYAALHAKQFWDGRAKDVEEQAGMPILNPIEHNIPSKEFLVNRLKANEKYQELFKNVFPNETNPITFENIAHVIGAFERKLIPVSVFDTWLDGHDAVLNEQEKRGLNAFIKHNCTSCHNGIAIGGQMMQKFGTHYAYWLHTNSKKIDNGLYDITKNENDKYVFKVPSLRNIAKTAPYFHDGSVNDLKEAVLIMSKVQNNKFMSDDEAEDIVAFLKTLTAEVDSKYKQ